MLFLQGYVRLAYDQVVGVGVEVVVGGVIIVLVTTSNRISYSKGTEPDALFGDPSGDSGIDFAGWSIKSIKLLVTDLVLIYGFDPSQGAYTNIAVQGIVTINYNNRLLLDANFSAAPTDGKIPLTVNFTDNRVRCRVAVKQG